MSLRALSFGALLFGALFFSLLSFSACVRSSAAGKRGNSPVSNSSSASPELSLAPVKNSAVTVNAAAPPAASVEEGRTASRSDPHGKSDLKFQIREIPLSNFSSFSVHQGEINALVVTKDGGRAYTGGNDGRVVCSTIIKPDSKNKQVGARPAVEERTLLQGTRPILALALSDDGNYLAIAQFSSVLVFDLQHREIVNHLTRVSGRLLSLAFDPRGELIALGRASGETFIWNLKNGSAAGRDSLDAVEQYGSADGSPIVRLAFHPSGRAFVAGAENGSVVLWRLLRTESELGLRDSGALIDLDKKGSNNIPIAQLGARIEDLSVNKNAELLVAAADGKVYRWKLRGVERLDDMTFGADSAGSVQELYLFDNSARFFASTGRGQKMKFWCKAADNSNSVDADDLSGSRKVTVIPSDQSGANSDQSASETQIVDGRLVVGSALLARPENRPAKTSENTINKLFAETDFLKDPIHILRVGGTGPVLWAAQKKGNLLVFDTRRLAESDAGTPWTEKALAGCGFQ